MFVKDGHLNLCGFFFFLFILKKAGIIRSPANTPELVIEFQFLIMDLEAQQFSCRGPALET